MPEPNLPPLRLVDDDASRPDKINVIDINDYRTSMPELPATTRQRMVDKLGLTLDMASRIVNEPELQTFFHKAMQSPDPPQDANIAANLGRD
jgi:Asp-tRNA(Asn)/Glu-tRNA(Gln) amidotransferase B subunit